MIVECEKCKSQFNVEESVVKADGSKVRCSVCRNIFIVYPKADTDLDAAPELTIDDDLEETVALDSPPRLKPPARDRDEIPIVALDELTTDADGAEIESADAGVSFEEDLADESGPFMEKEGEPTYISPTGVKSGRSPALPIVLIVLVLLIGAGAGVYFFYPGLLAGFGFSGKPAGTKTETKDPGILKLRIQPQSVESYFLKSDAGELFIVKGIVGNNYPTARGRISLQVSIFDGGNKVILKKTAFAGNVFSDEELKKMTGVQIEAAMKNAAGKDNQNLKVEPGATVPFMVVFSNLPENAKDFSPDLVGSTIAN